MFNRGSALIAPELGVSSPGNSGLAWTCFGEKGTLLSPRREIMWGMVESTGAVACGVQTKEGTRLPTQIFEKLLWEGGLGLLRRQNISINISVQ